MTTTTIIHHNPLEFEIVDAPSRYDSPTARRNINAPQISPEINPRHINALLSNAVDDIDLFWDDVAELDYSTGPRVTGEQVQAAVVTRDVDLRTLSSRHNASTPTKAADDAPNMHSAALGYAQLGWHVFPLHNPIHDAGGHVTGCTCETWKREKIDPDYKCDNPGKCPAVRWSEKSTIDPKQIHKWWGHAWGDGYIKNIGIDCGKSGLLVLDADEYKDHYDGASLLTFEEQETTTAITGSSGQHFIYKMPDGKSYGNGTGSLPAGIDIRGTGGYIVAAPSMHKSGERYVYEADYNPIECPPQPLPQKIVDILDAAQRTTTATNATFMASTTDAPDLTQWRLSAQVREKINTPAPRGQRSESDMSVCVSLAYAGATDDDILAVFEHHPIGTAGKFSERGRTYLAHTIGRARAFVAENPRAEPAQRLTNEQLAALRNFIHEQDIGRFIETGRYGSRGYLSMGTDRAVLDAILDELESGLYAYMPASRLARAVNMGVSGVRKSLERLCDNILEVRTERDSIRQSYRYRFQQSFVDFVVSLARALYTEDSVYNNARAGDTTNFGDNDHQTYSDNRSGDAYTNRATSPKARALGNTRLPLGKNGLSVIDALVNMGEATRAELVSATSLRPGSVANATRRLEEYGIAEGYRDAPREPKRYALIEDWTGRVGDLLPEMKTYMIGAERSFAELQNRAGFYEEALQKNLAPEEKRRYTRQLAKTKIELGAVVQELAPDRTSEEVTAIVEDARPRAAARAQRNEFFRHLQGQTPAAIIDPLGRVTLPHGLNRTRPTMMNGRILIPAGARGTANGEHQLDSLPRQQFSDPAAVYDYLLAIPEDDKRFSDHVACYLHFVGQESLTRPDMDQLHRATDVLGVPGYAWMNQPLESQRVPLWGL